MKEDTKKLLRLAGMASTIGIQLVVAVFIGLFFGLALDKWLGTSPWFTLIFLVLGVIAGFLNYYRFAKKQQEDNEKGA